MMPGSIASLARGEQGIRALRDRHTHDKDARIVIFDGGVPLNWDGEIVGAIGVSGGLADSQDQPVVEAGAAAL